MTKYKKDHFDWDFGKYMSEIGRITNSVYENIKKFTEFLNKEEPTPEIEIIESYGSTDLDPTLFKSLTELMTDLKNQSFHNSLIITVYSFLEYSLVEFCRLIDLYIEPEKRFKDIPQNGLDKCKDYLTSTFNFNISCFKKWNTIKEFQRIRNLMAHNNGNLYREYGKNLKEQPDYGLISGNKNLRISDSGTIFIKELSYITSLADTSVQLINFTLENIRKEFDE